MSNPVFLIYTKFCIVPKKELHHSFYAHKESLCLIGPSFTFY